MPLGAAGRQRGVHLGGHLHLPVAVHGQVAKHVAHRVDRVAQSRREGRRAAVARRPHLEPEHALLAAEHEVGRRRLGADRRVAGQVRPLPEHQRRAVRREAHLVRDRAQRQAARQVAAVGEREEGVQDRRQAALHVARAAAVQPSVGDLARAGGTGPQRCVAVGVDVHVAVQHEVRAGRIAADGGDEVRHVVLVGDRRHVDPVALQEARGRRRRRVACRRAGSGSAAGSGVTRRRRSRPRGRR